MPKTKLERIADIEDTMRQLENQRKQLLQQQKEQEHKARTKRLIERGAILESLIPNATMLTNEQIKAFLEKTVQSEYARKILDGLNPQRSMSPTDKSEATTQGEG